MPFYDQNDLAAQREKLTREVAYLRQVVKTVEQEKADARLHDRTAR